MTHWKVALVCGNPENVHESFCFTNFAGPDAVCAMVRGAETGEVREPTAPDRAEPCGES